MKKLKLLKARAETRPLSDASKLAWSQYQGPMQAAAQQLNAAITSAQNVIAAQLIKSEGLDPSEWFFDMDRLVLVRRPSEE